MTQPIEAGEDIVTGAIAPPHDDALIYETTPLYLGCFRLPTTNGRYDFPPKGMCYNPAHNSLFIAGFADNHGVGEVTIPTPIRGAASLNDLNRATALQPVTDPTNGSFALLSNGAGINLGGFLIHNNKLIVTAYRFYDADGTQPFSHWSRNTNLSIGPDYVGPVPLLVTDAVGTPSVHAGNVSGYMADVPVAWQNAFGGRPCLTGQCGISIVSRTSYGPDVFAFDPAQIGVVAPVPTTPLLFYPGSHPLDSYSSQSTLFNGTMQMGGVVFPVGWRSVLFFGLLGLGKYGYGVGTSDPALDGQPVPDQPGVFYFFDPVNPAKGDHAYPYQARVWAYDALDLAAVASGVENAWDVRPYAVWTLTSDFYSFLPRLAGAAYDPATQRIYVLQTFGDGDAPLVHVYSVVPPAPPSITLHPDSSVSTWAALTASLAYGVVTISATAALSTWTVSTATLTKGSATITASSALSTWTLPAATVTGENIPIALHPDSAVSTWTEPAATLTKGSATVTASSSVATWTMPSTTLTKGRATITTSAAVRNWVVPSADIQYHSTFLPVVPGAFGFGMSTRAAYGGSTAPVVLRVTNLNDSGLGSLRAALEASGPRVVIFEISGTIVLDSDIAITDPYITVAGQTAPSPGITIRGAMNASESAGGLNIFTHDILIQHLRIRPGDGGPTLPSTAAHDAVLVYTENAYNVVFDHNSVSWSGGKNFQTYHVGANMTFWRNITSEGLYRARNVTEDWAGTGAPSSFGILIDSNSAGVSLIGNLFAHCSDRNPQTGQGTTLHLINNVIFDWGKDLTNFQWATFFYAGPTGSDPSLIDIIGNKYIAGPPPSPFTPLYAVGIWSNMPVGSKFYLNDNAIDQTRQAVLEFDNHMSSDPRVGSPPVSLSGITVRPSSTIEAYVLANAGARPADRDVVDIRIVNEVTNRTGTVISSQSEVGGWPTLAVNTRSLTLPPNPNDVTASGYTNLEVWLHNYAWDVET